MAAYGGTWASGLLSYIRPITNRALETTAGDIGTLLGYLAMYQAERDKAYAEVKAAEKTGLHSVGQTFISQCHVNT